MLPVLSAIQTVLPYLLAIWLTPFMILAVKMVRRPAVGPLESIPYLKNRGLFSPAARSLLRLLEQAAGEQYRILAHVPAAEIVTVKFMSDRDAFIRALDQISARNFDFVLCDKEYLSIACAIQLNDSSRRSQRDHQPDTFLDDLCKTISLPLVRVIAPDDLSVDELRRKIHAALHQGLEAAAAISEQPFSVGLDSNRTALGKNPEQLQIRRTL